jgi:hypothetical protein
MVPLGYARTDVELEAERCTLLCANCPRTLHRERPPPAERGWTDVVTGGDASARVRPEDVDPDGTLTRRERPRRWSLLVRGRYECGECGDADPACLDFHHPEVVEKTRTVSSMISESEPIDDIVAEANDCVVLCGNCYRAQHRDSPGSDRV